MQIKLSIKIIILFILIFLIFIGGGIMFYKMRHNKNVIDTDLKNYIPVEVSTVLQINKDKDIQTIKNYTTILDSISVEISKNLTYPIYLIANDSHSAMLGRITNEQEVEVRKTISKFYPAFPPKERVYKDATFLFYPISNDRFLCCLFYNGIFIYGYNSNFLEKIVETNSENNFFNEFNSSQLLSHVSTLYSANLFYKKDNISMVYNIPSSHDNLSLDGYSNLSYKKQNQTQTNTTKLTIDYSIFPNNCLGFNIKNNFSLVATPISEYLILPHYTFYLSNKQNDDIVYAIKHSNDRFILYNFLNNLEFKFTGKKFDINDFAYGNQRIYTTSEKLSEYIFDSKSNFYLSFYNGYLIYSKNKKSLISYLLNNGKYKTSNQNFLEDLEINNKTISKEILDIFYSQSTNINLVYSDAFKQILNSPNIEIYGILKEEKDITQLKILLNKN